MIGDFFITMSVQSKPPEVEVLNCKFLKPISAFEDICCSEVSTLFKAVGNL